MKRTENVSRYRISPMLAYIPNPNLNRLQYLNIVFMSTFPSKT